MSQIETTVDNDDFNLEELFQMDGLGEGLSAAIESVHIVYQGILTTPKERYGEPEIQDALTRRLNTISAGTGVSLEGLIENLQSLSGVEVSQERSFMEVVEIIVQQIIEWLSKVKEFFKNLWKKVFNRKSTVTASAKANNARYASTMHTYTKQQKDPPTTVKCNVPGRCYLIFHAKPHVPKAGFVYNQAGMDRAIDGVSRDMDRVIQVMSDECDSTIKAVERLLGALEDGPRSQLGNTTIRNIDEPLKDLKLNRKMFGLYHDRFEVAGMGIIAKPMRRATRFHSEKYGFTDTVRTHGWAGVDSFDITLDVKEIKKLNDAVIKNANDKLTAIALLVSRVGESRAIGKLTDLAKDTRSIVNLASMNDAPSSTDLSNRRANLERMELMMEYVGQLSDNLSLLYSFYARYIEMVSVIAQKAVAELANYS